MGREICKLRKTPYNYHRYCNGILALHTFFGNLLTGIKSEPGSSGPASPVQGSSSARASPIRSASSVPSTPPPNSASNSGSSSTENSPNIDGERGDLIEFYNKVMTSRSIFLELHQHSNGNSKLGSQNCRDWDWVLIFEKKLCH